MQFGVLDRIRPQQALITGQILDALTERPPLYPPTVTLLYQTPVGEPERRYPLTARLYRNERFVFAGSPATAFPRLSTSGTLDLVLRVAAPRYQTGEIQFSLSQADLTLREETLEIDGRTLQFSLLEVPLWEGSIHLQPEPLHLNGRLVEAENPERPIHHAEVRIVAPSMIGPQQTDNDGYFTFYSLPLVQEVRLQSQPAGFARLDTVLRLDYRQPVNQRTFAVSRP
jgi:hypothetical protein